MSYLSRLAAAAALVLAATPALAVPTVYPNPGTPAPYVASGFQVNRPATEIFRFYAYFTGLHGAYTVLGGARIGGVDGTPVLNNQTSAYGDRALLGYAHGLQPVIPFIDVVSTGNRFYMDQALNADGVNHVWYNIYGGDAKIPLGFNVNFEDIYGGGDYNYADYGMVITAVAGIPEPATWAMLILGFGVVGGAMRRRQRVSVRFA